MGYRKLFLGLALCTALACMAAPAAAAYSYAVDITPYPYDGPDPIFPPTGNDFITNSGAVNKSYSFGWEFTTNSAVTVTALGFYDNAGAHPWNVDHGVAIYKVSDQSLVASQTVTSSDTYYNFFRYSAISPVVLASGETYRITAATRGDVEDWITIIPSSYTVHSSITDPLVMSAGYYFWNEEISAWNPVETTTPDYPNLLVEEDAWFGPNFQILQTDVVPVPGTLLLVASGLLGLLGWRRKLTKG